MSRAIKEFAAIGERLPNGALLVDRTWTRTEDWADGLVYHEAVVLCVLNHGQRREFATWIYCLDPRQGEVTISGHYFDSIEQAVADYVKRSEAMMQTGIYAPVDVTP
jgi:hypothetical protein